MDSNEHGPDPTHEEIAERAHALFEARGGYPGGAEDDWTAAEQQLRAERTPAPAAPLPKEVKPRPLSRSSSTGPQRPTPSRRS